MGVICQYNTPTEIFFEEINERLQGKTMNPSHQDQVVRLRKIEGQVKGIEKMVTEKRYCIDILTQIKAVKAALNRVEIGILEGHMQHCLKKAVQSKDKKVIDEKINEVLSLLSHRIK